MPRKNEILVFLVPSLVVSFSTTLKNDVICATFAPLLYGERTCGKMKAHVIHIDAQRGLQKCCGFGAACGCVVAVLVDPSQRRYLNVTLSVLCSELRRYGVTPFASERTQIQIVYTSIVVVGKGVWRDGQCAPAPGLWSLRSPGSSHIYPGEYRHFHQRSTFAVLCCIQMGGGMPVLAIFVHMVVRHCSSNIIEKAEPTLKAFERKPYCGTPFAPSSAPLSEVDATFAKGPRTCNLRPLGAWRMRRPGHVRVICFFHTT